MDLRANIEAPREVRMMMSAVCLSSDGRGGAATMRGDQGLQRESRSRAPCFDGVRTSDRGLGEH